METLCPATTTVPARATPAAAATVNVAVPGPVNDDGPETAIQGCVLLTVHGHAGPVATVTVTVPPAFGTVCAAGVASYAQAALCVTLNRKPAAVMVPVRGAPVVATTSNCTAALPLPDEPDLTTIHGESDDAVQAQSWLDARTSKWPEPPAWPKLLEGSDNE